MLLLPALTALSFLVKFKSGRWARRGINLVESATLNTVVYEISSQTVTPTGGTGSEGFEFERQPLWQLLQRQFNPIWFKETRQSKMLSYRGF
ncbi:hypothetical protein B0H17DRAFT_1039185 [Mycena rosella]|uniref:Uncharacterized protein n=1 Tax=Mycena rosella TaxID=1033263 RepID=A0AAD7GSH6_MYCRO|nr:hypothetical protein B0H17DRAFT_1039185 [Mycena rosella]